MKRGLKIALRYSKEVVFYFIWLLIFTLIFSFAVGKAGITDQALIEAGAPIVLLVSLLSFLKLRKAPTDYLRKGKQHSVSFYLKTVCGSIGVLFLLLLIVNFTLGLFFKLQTNVDVEAVNQHFWLTAFNVALISPFCEEVIFRGAMFGALRKEFSPLLSMIIVSVVFGIVHFNLAAFFLCIFLSMLLCMLTLETGNIWLAALIHGLYNFISTVLVRMEGPVEDAILIVLSIFGLICIILCFRSASFRSAVQSLIEVKEEENE